MATTDSLNLTVKSNVPESPEVVSTMVHDAVDFLDNEHSRRCFHQSPPFEEIELIVTTEPVQPVQSSVTGFGVAHLQYKHLGTVEIPQNTSTDEPCILLNNLPPNQASSIEWVGQLEQLYHKTNTPNVSRQAQIDFIESHAPEARAQLTKKSKK